MINLKHYSSVKMFNGEKQLVCSNWKKLIFILLIDMSVLVSCGNIINENVLSETDSSVTAENSVTIDENENSGIVFKELNRKFSTSGDIRIEKTAGEGYYIAGTVVEDIADNVWFSIIDNKGNFKNEVK